MAYAEGESEWILLEQEAFLDGWNCGWGGCFCCNAVRRFYNSAARRLIPDPFLRGQCAESVRVSRFCFS